MLNLIEEMVWDGMGWNEDKATLKTMSVYFAI